MKVYIVTSGEYSDYSIDAVFSSEEKAKEYLGNSPVGHYDIQEYEVDTEPAMVFREEFFIALRLDGTLDPIYSDKSDLGGHIRNVCVTGKTEEELVNGISRTVDWYNLNKYRLTQGWFYGTSYTSRPHALQLATAEREKALQDHPEWF